jgi:hypothetical protein
MIANGKWFFPGSLKPNAYKYQGNDPKPELFEEIAHTRETIPSRNYPKKNAHTRMGTVGNVPKPELSEETQTCM